MKKICVFLLVNVFVSFVFAGGKIDSDYSAEAKPFKLSYKQKKIEGEPVEFSEVWGWVMKGREHELDNDFPLTDIGYFAAEVNSYGELTAVPDRSKLNLFSSRVHLVLVCDSRALTHFLLDPTFGLIDKFIQDVMIAAQPFDGVQVDFELIPAKDKENFLSFLNILSEKCKENEKMFSVCVPARLRTISDDVFPYEEISKIADRIMIMAYDEHWSTSKSGPVASVEWCEKIAGYAASVIPAEKLVMGLPFYGRTWANEKPAQGWYFSGINRIMREYNSGKVEYVDYVPSVKIDMKVHIDAWFEDSYSTVAKMRLYKSKNVEKIAFWRIGQEDPSVWKWIKVLPREIEIDTEQNLADLTVSVD